MAAKILVVDDEIQFVEMMANRLKTKGYEVMTAASGVEALSLVRQSEPDLLILDIRLGDESGLELLRHLLEIRPSLCVILNSGYSTYRDDFSSWLADAYLLKSSDTGTLREKVRELLTSSGVGNLARALREPGRGVLQARGLAHGSQQHSLLRDHSALTLRVLS